MGVWVYGCFKPTAVILSEVGVANCCDHCNSSLNHSWPTRNSRPIRRPTRHSSRGRAMMLPCATRKMAPGRPSFFLKDGIHLSIVWFRGTVSDSLRVFFERWHAVVHLFFGRWHPSLHICVCARALECLLTSSGAISPGHVGYDQVQNHLT